MSTHGCLGSSAGGGGAAAVAVAVAAEVAGERRGKEGGGPPRAVHAHTFKFPRREWRWGCSKRRPGEVLSVLPVLPPLPLAPCSLAVPELRIRVAIRGSEGKRARGAGEDAHPAVPDRHICLYEPAH